MGKADLYNKLEIWIENSKDVDEIRNAFIEVISNNEIDFRCLYSDHKESIEKEFARDQAAN